MDQQLSFLGAPVQVDAAHARRAWLGVGREAAARLCLERGTIATEDLRGLVPPPPSENQWGALLCSPWFVQGGEHASRHPSAHGRRVRRWLLTASGRKELLGL